MRFWQFLSLLPFIFCFLPSKALAIVDPQAVPNNKFGIHIITPSLQEASEAAQMVNSKGDWGYVTFIIEDRDRQVDKWQTFFNQLRRYHLIPIVRIATHPDQSFWARPQEGEEGSWAEFLNSLIWPIKNRYVVIFNEPNQAREWDNAVDPQAYAKILDKYILALKGKSADFFVLNAGFDASAPQKIPSYEDEADFLHQMNDTIPGIFDKLDGWVSHSYPNPNFSGSVSDSGRGSIKTYQWEKQQLSALGVKKDLPVFITETGWKHAEGSTFDGRYLSAKQVAQNFKKAFLESWPDGKIVAITPFLLDYQADPFEHFSFKRPSVERQKFRIISSQVLVAENSSLFYPQYQTIADLVKTVATPVQENLAELKESNFYNTIIVSQDYPVYLKIKNIGQSIWGEKGHIKLKATTGQNELGMSEAFLPEGTKVEPGQEYTFTISLNAPFLGQYKGALALFEGENLFLGEPFYFTTQVKSAVILNIKSELAGKKDSGGEYILSYLSNSSQLAQKISLSSDGTTQNLQFRTLFPDTIYDFTLSKPYYQPKSLTQKLTSGQNSLDFGTLEPDLPSIVLNPSQLWKILPVLN